MPISKLPEVVTVTTASQAKKHIIRSIIDNCELKGVVVLHDDAGAGYHSALAKLYNRARKRMTDEYARTLDLPRRSELRTVLDGLPLNAFVSAYGEEAPVVVIPAREADAVSHCMSLYVACAVSPAVERLIQRSAALERVVFYSVVPEQRTPRRPALVPLVPRDSWREHLYRHTGLY